MNSDINKDGKVDGRDLTQLSTEFGNVGNFPSDINQDGTVDGRDLSLLAQDFGTVINPPTGSGDIVRGNAHYEAEIQKPGVHAYVSWRNQSEIDRDKSGFGVSDPSDPAWPKYDSVKDAARIPVFPKGGLAQLRNRFSWIGNSVWSQYEIMLSTNMLSNEYEPYSMKLWRWEDETKQQCSDQRRLTHNCGLGPEPHVYHRDGCQIPDGEVRVDGPDGLDAQPGGVTKAIYREFLPHDPSRGDRNWTFRWPNAQETWMRLTYHFDFGNQMLHIWAFRYDNDQAYKIVEFEVPGWNERFGMDVAGCWLQSTSRTHDQWPASLTPGNVWCRNQIISSQPISF